MCGGGGGGEEKINEKHPALCVHKEDIIKMYYGRTIKATLWDRKYKGAWTEGMKVHYITQKERRCTYVCIYVLYL